jgi:hypothetical protein
MYTNEQLNAMTVDQLRAAIIALQGQQAGPAPIAVPTIAETPKQIDIENMKAAIAQFEAVGAKVFPDEFAAMTQKLADMEAKVKTEAEAVLIGAKNEIADLETKEATWSENFRTKHGVSWQVAFIGGAFVLWQIGTSVARVLGVL